MVYKKTRQPGRVLKRKIFIICHQSEISSEFSPVRVFKITRWPACLPIMENAVSTFIIIKTVPICGSRTWTTNNVFRYCSSSSIYNCEDHHLSGWLPLITSPIAILAFLSTFSEAKGMLTSLEERLAIKLLWWKKTLRYDFFSFFARWGGIAPTASTL